MAKKKEIGLMICDIDNTVSDYFLKWAKTTDRAIKKLAELHGIPEKAIYDDIAENVTFNNRFYDITALIRESKILLPKTREEAVKFEKGHARIAHECDKERNNDKAYAGVLPLLRKAKEAGTKIVFYTDAPANLAVMRLAGMGAPVDSIDGVYGQPDTSTESGRYIRPILINGQTKRYLEELGDKVVVLDDRKPSPTTMQKILDKFEIKDASKVVMVGDNVRSDGGGAIPLGMEFAWQKQGAEVDDLCRHVDRMLCGENTSYKLGVEGHLEQMNDENRPTVVLEKGFKELAKYYKFVPIEKAQKKVKETEKIITFVKKLANNIGR